MGRMRTSFMGAMRTFDGADGPILFVVDVIGPWVGMLGLFLMFI